MVIKEMVHITPYHLDRMLHIYLPDDYEESERDIRSCICMMGTIFFIMRMLPTVNPGDCRNL